MHGLVISVRPIAVREVGRRVQNLIKAAKAAQNPKLPRRRAALQFQTPLLHNRIMYPGRSLKSKLSCFMHMDMTISAARIQTPEDCAQ